MKKTKIKELMLNEGLTITDVIDCAIEVNGIIGVGLITLGEKLNDYCTKKLQSEITVRKRRNFLSPDKKVARNSYGEYFSIGDTVIHDDKIAREAIIASFEFDIENNEVKANTNEGWSHIDFISIKKYIL
jgi:hypothetical protein